MGWTAWETWSNFFQGQETFFVLQSIHTGSGFCPAYPVGNGRCFPLGTKWSQHEVDLSPSSSAEIRNAWICTFIPSCGFVMWCLTLILLTWWIWWAPTNASKWQMKFNSAFKGLIKHVYNFTLPSCANLHASPEC
jgi:hypothetical protein